VTSPMDTYQEQVIQDTVQVMTKLFRPEHRRIVGAHQIGFIQGFLWAHRKYIDIDVVMAEVEKRLKTEAEIT
jgi:uncharacterized protein YllA (UPF0747 family)